jgi:hypothetical protein
MADEFTEGAVSDEPTKTAATLEEANAAGFLGSVFDPNDDEAYTFKGAASRIGANLESAPASTSSSSGSSGSGSSKSSKGSSST